MAIHRHIACGVAKATAAKLMAKPDRHSHLWLRHKTNWWREN
jgi:hypothetical protein